jgi:hypothetical protein
VAIGADGEDPADTWLQRWFGLPSQLKGDVEHAAFGQRGRLDVAFLFLALFPWILL